jgi:hypothetical protein
MKTETGGPAFPNEGFNGWGEPFQGMTLRDYFAAKALPVALGGLNPAYQENLQLIARRAYDIADAMLEARK